MNKTSAFVFFTVLAVGVGISYLTLSRVLKKEEAPVDYESNALLSQPGGEMDSPSKAETREQKAERASSATSSSESSARNAYPSPEKAMQQLESLVHGNDFAAFEKQIGPAVIRPAVRDEVRKLIESPDWKVNQEQPIVGIAKTATAQRWALNFISSHPAKAAPIAGSSAKAQLIAELEKVGKTGVDFKSIDLAGAHSTTSGAPDLSDSISVAQGFSEALIARDFQRARSFTDLEKVTDERLAALMIAVEEGGFELKGNPPLVVTLSRDDIAWVITRIGSGEMRSEFAQELSQKNGEWRVAGLTFSKVLSALAQQAGGGDVAYSPIVEDPAGGDSLVLYFEFDSAGVTSRTKRQLAIISDILSQDDARIVRINGHADALGTDQYNRALSDGRATAIRESLIQMGVSPSQIVAEGFGESKPRRPNFKPDGSDNPQGRSQNRRAEVYLDF